MLLQYEKQRKKDSHCRKILYEEKSCSDEKKLLQKKKVTWGKIRFGQSEKLLQKKETIEKQVIALKKKGWCKKKSAVIDKFIYVFILIQYPGDIWEITDKSEMKEKDTVSGIMK